jgi:GH35 family endo-1,4-beta-xylanase
MKMADLYFSPKNQLAVNATTRNSWIDFDYEDSPLYLLIKNLQLQDLRIDYIGMQFHLWYGREFINGLYNGTTMPPEHLYQVLDQYAQLGLPIHITEVTLPIVLYQEVAEAWQAILGTNYLRLLFSHPNVECITWWNFTDELTRDGKHYRGALTGENLRLKPLYHAVRKQIKEEWQTRLQLRSNKDGQIPFRGFYGKYNIQFERNGHLVDSVIHLKKDTDNAFNIGLE